YSVTDITNVTTYAGLPYPVFNDVRARRDLIDITPLNYDGCGSVIAHMKYDICEGNVIGSNVCNGTFTPHLKFPEYDLTQIPGSGYDSQSCKATSVGNGGGQGPVTTLALILGNENGQGQGQNQVKTQSLAVVNEQPNYQVQVATSNSNANEDGVAQRPTVGGVAANSGTSVVVGQGSTGGSTGGSPVTVLSNPGIGNPVIATAALQVDNSGSSAIQTAVVPQDSGVSQNQGTGWAAVSQVNLPVIVPSATVVVVVPDAPFVPQVTSTRTSTQTSSFTPTQSASIATETGVGKAIGSTKSNASKLKLMVGLFGLFLFPFY
ncbi:hypothetical protein HDU79_001357, partial [Rhizoclosmatium sp. JEL0117]